MADFLIDDQLFVCCALGKLQLFTITGAFGLRNQYIDRPLHEKEKKNSTCGRSR
jgi:hypothetical protein